MELHIDFQNKIGRIKPMHGVGQPPLVGVDTSYFKYLSEANIPYSRLHDVGGWFGGNLFVDIPNIFRDFNADVENEDSYDFTFTDILIKALVENDCEPYFRLGVTIENFRLIKAYRIFPPEDFEKWARICEHIVRHYNEGWANGFHYNIKYWEIWNEPDDESAETSSMWRGTPEQYFELYAVTAKHLRKCFGDTIKIGGYSCTGLNTFVLAAEMYGDLPPEDIHFYYRDRKLVLGNEQTEDELEWEKNMRARHKFFDDFLNKVVTEKLPFDYFSYHSYIELDKAFIIQNYIEKRLEMAGLDNVEIHLNEWNNYVEGWNTPEGTKCRGTSGASANCAALMCGMQNTKMTLMCYYDARIGVGFLGGLFNPLSKEPFCTYYAMKAYGKLYNMGNQVEISGLGEDIYAVAAASGSKCGVLISNVGESKKITTNLPEDMDVYLIDEDNLMSKTSLNPGSFTINKHQVIYIERNM